MSREQLAARARCHRNTVLNVESGRAVKFATIRELMNAMGYATGSDEMKLIALLWLEAVTGVVVSAADAQRLSADANKRVKDTPAFRLLSAEVVAQRLQRDDVDLLTFAARHRKVMNALRAIRELVPEQVRIPARSV